MSDTNNVEQSLPVETQPELVNTAPAEDPVIAHERAMFTRYVQDQGQKIPSNFKDADAWFNSLVEARKGFTQARQEIAALKKQYNENGVVNPNFQEQPVSTTPDQPKEDLSSIDETLQIKAQDASKPPVGSRVSAEDWTKWGREIDSTGNVSPATRAEIKERMGADDVIIEQMIRGRKALAKQSWDEAASVVGGGDNLKRLFKWAQSSFSKEEIEATNRALQSNAYKNVLIGLKARFESENKTKQPLSQEPRAVENRVNASQAPQQVQVFKNMSEQRAALSDPRYRTDANFRKAVEQMIINTSRYGFRNR
jgi:hypothetical protein